MKSMMMLVALLSMSSPLLGQPQASAQSVRGSSQHDREFWRAIAKNRYAVPEGQQVYLLMHELSGYLGSRDPELRDDLAYTITAVWIKHQKQISADELNSLLDEWRSNLRVGVGESGTDSVLKRSFSALCLSELAERDLKMPFLTEQRYRTLMADALAYLKDERDLRGFDSQLGWIHATAHTADLLAALAGNPFLRPEEQAVLLGAISGRLSSAHEIFMFGEQDRLGRAAATIVLRKDFNSAGFADWLRATDATDQRVWKDSPPRLELLQAFENDAYMLRGLANYLSMNASEAAVVDAQNTVFKVLRAR